MYKQEAIKMKIARDIQLWITAGACEGINKVWRALQKKEIGDSE